MPSRSLSSPSSESASPSPVPESSGRAPHTPTFAVRKHWLGWQGFTFTLPADWHLASFSGEAKKGNLRVDDGDGPRIELRWETPDAGVDLEKSIDDFVKRLARDAKKKKRAFHSADHPDLVARNRKPKAQIVNFGWTSDHQEPLAAHGWGTAWKCAECGRVSVAHLLGRAGEKPRVAQQLASDIFTSLDCHGQGGWQAWSVFGCSVEIPLDFVLSKAKLQTGRIEIEWQRAAPQGMAGWLARPERLVLRRVSAANLLLENESLEDWARRTSLWLDKKSRWHEAHEWSFRGHEGLEVFGEPRPWKERMAHKLRARLTRRFRLQRGITQTALHLWHDEEANKIIMLESELLHSNQHVGQDVLDSLEYE